MTAAEAQAVQLAGLSQGMSDYQRGTCVAVRWETLEAQVNLRGSTYWMPMAGVSPVPQRECWVGFLGAKPMCLGPVPRPALGVVQSAPAGGLVSVKADDDAVYSLANTELELVAGQRVLIQWDGGGSVVGVLSADPVTHDDLIPDPPVIRPPDGGAPQPVVFNATDSGTQNGSGLTGAGSFWTAQVYCGDSTLGAFLYGGQMANTIPDNANCTGIRIYVDAVSSRGNPPRFGLHSLDAKTGQLVVDHVYQPPEGGGTGWKTLPVEWAGILARGERRGIATAHGGIHIYSPAGQRNSGALEITYGSS